MRTKLGVADPDLKPLLGGWGGIAFGAGGGGAGISGRSGARFLRSPLKEPVGRVGKGPPTPPVEPDPGDRVLD